MTQCTKQFDWNKPYRTRDGGMARVICTDRKSAYGSSTVALVSEDKEGFEHTLTYQTCGHFLVDHSYNKYDLINISDTESELERVKRELSKIEKSILEFRQKRDVNYDEKHLPIIVAHYEIRNLIASLEK